MKQFLFSFIILFLFATTSSAASLKGEGPVQTQNRTLDVFDQVLVQGTVTLHVHKGEYKGVSLTAHANLLENIQTTVTSKTLTISSKESYSTTQPIVIAFSVPELRTIITEGTVSAKLNQLDQSMLILRNKGASNVYMDGKVKMLIIDQKGTGQIMSKDLIAQDVKVALSGTGYVAVHAVKTLNAAINGVGTVEYSGKPQVTKNITGLGKLVSME